MGGKYIVAQDAVYNGIHNKIKMICKKHGEFEIEANRFVHGKFVKSVSSFLRGHGCHYCSKEATSLRMITPTEDYIKKANKIHNNKYSYTKTDLYNRDKNGKIIITCPIHGDFKQKELVNDMMMLIASFSGRVYSLRTKKIERNVNKKS